jgi:hypothetical protein
MLLLWRVKFYFSYVIVNHCLESRLNEKIDGLIKRKNTYFENFYHEYHIIKHKAEKSILSVKQINFKVWESVSTQGDELHGFTRVDCWPSNH